MVYQGTVHNGVIVFASGVCLPEGAPVRVELVTSPGEAGVTACVEDQLDPVWRIGELAVDTGVPDLGANIDHYLYGHPKAHNGR